MIIEIALAIVLAVIILRFLPEILALGTIAIVIGLLLVAFAVLVIAGINFSQTSEFRTIAELVLGVMILACFFAVVHVGFVSKRQQRQKAIQAKNDVSAETSKVVDKIVRRSVQRWVTFTFFAVLTAILVTRWSEFTGQQVMMPDSDRSMLLLFIVWLVCGLLFFRALTKHIDAPFFGSPKH